LAKKPSARKQTKAEKPFPTREQILQFIAENPDRSGKRDIARAFGVTGGARIALKALIGDLVDKGQAERKRRRLTRPGDLPPVSVLAVSGRDKDGELLAVPVEWPEERGPPPTALIVADRRGKAPSPGVGDRVLARLSPGAPDGPPYSARVIKVLERRPDTVLGVVRVLPTGARIEPVDRKQKEVIVETGGLGKAKEGDLVSVETTRPGRYGLAAGRVKEIIGSMKSEKAVSLIAIHAHAIPHVFPPETLDEARAARPASPTGRDDWRKLPLVTIDPPDARDHDDAVHAEADPDPRNPGGFVVTVAIADVACYVRPGSALDREALNRGNSVYFPDRVVPMLPERISNDLCSLREGEDRPAIAVRMIFSADGRKRSHRFHRVVMRSAARLAYAEAQHVFDGGTIKRGRRVVAALRTLWDAYQVVTRGREAREPLDLDLPERKVVLGADGAIERIVVPARLEAHRLIEEFMIQANVAAAETLEARKSPLVYRIHDTPSLAKLEALRQFLASIELTLPKGGNLRPSHFNRILSRARKTEHSQLLSEVVLRTQAQAEYSPENIGHFGLNLRRYAHFTSPIRRYADLLVHRALIRGLKLGKDGLPDGIEAELAEIAARISAAERRAMAAERDTIDRLVAHWLADRIGATFTGRISGVTRAGLFVRLDDSGADGFVPMGSLGSDYFVYDEARHSITGRRTGESYRLGDTVEVRLIEAAPLAGALRFELLSEGRVVPRSHRPKGERRERRHEPGGSRQRRAAAR
jgi:ribonuclease R